ncbi:MAG: ABC transporter ATP-binding protein [Akkermansiaceae bacterium]|nr:ABC transporter ATP-binding protein [Akkermansiaceae bacterium]
MPVTSPSSEPKPDAEPSTAGRRSCLRLIRETGRDLGWRYPAFVPVAALLSAVFLLPPRLLQFFADAARAPGDLPADRFVFLLAVFGLAIAAACWVSAYLGGLLREWLRLRIGVRLRADALRGIHRTPLEALDRAGRGDWMTRVTGDLRNVENFLADSLPEQIQSLTLAAGAAALFVAHSGWVAALPLAAAAGLAWLNLRVQRRAAPVLRDAREIEGDVFQSLIENFEGLRTVRGAGAERRLRERFRSRLEAFYATGMRVIRSMAGLFAVNEFATQFVVAAALALLAYLLRRGDLTVENVLVYPFFLNVFLGAAKSLAASAYDWNRFFIEGGRLAEIVFAEDPATVTLPPLPAETHAVRRLRAEKLEVGHPGAPPLLRDFDFEVARGEIVVLRGPSGSGKTTLLEVLAGLRKPARGGFRVHGGEESDRVSTVFDSVPIALCAHVEQRPWLFAGTIRENLTLGLDDDAAPAEAVLWERLARTGLEAAVRSRGGLDAALSDRGLNFSEGQRYRLTLSRALLRERPFLLLDEPFAALDDASIARLVETLRRARADGLGIVLATHQLPPELRPDRVFRLSS